MFKEVFHSELNLIESYLRLVLSEKSPCPRPELARFWESMSYSLFTDGKRFRPLLSILTAKALGQPPEQTLPLAAAVELIHTYSLIHDDLPVMDNDDFRRGKPTNHKVYGEAQALLAGDGLLTLAFGILAESKSPRLSRALRLLSQAAGPAGMVGGQILDIEAKQPTEDQLSQIHARKTGALIAVAVEGAAVLVDSSDADIQRLAEYGTQLGLAFQIADDLQDYDPKKPENVNFVVRLGLDGTRELLSRVSEQAKAAVAPYGARADGLRQMIQLNQQRV